jgi:hypothetical protein
MLGVRQRLVFAEIENSYMDYFGDDGRVNFLLEGDLAKALMNRFRGYPDWNYTEEQFIQTFIRSDRMANEIRNYKQAQRNQRIFGQQHQPPIVQNFYIQQPAPFQNEELVLLRQQNQLLWQQNNQLQSQLRETNERPVVEQLLNAGVSALSKYLTK